MINFRYWLENIDQFDDLEMDNYQYLLPIMGDELMEMPTAQNISVYIGKITSLSKNLWHIWARLGDQYQGQHQQIERNFCTQSIYYIMNITIRVGELIHDAYGYTATSMFNRRLSNIKSQIIALKSLQVPNKDLMQQHMPLLEFLDFVVREFRRIGLSGLIRNL